MEFLDSNPDKRTIARTARFFRIIENITLPLREMRVIRESSEVTPIKPLAPPEVDSILDRQPRRLDDAGGHVELIGPKPQLFDQDQLDDQVD